MLFRSMLPMLVHEHGKHRLVFLGAPDIFIRHSMLGPKEQKDALNRIDSLAESGELVIGVATKEINAKEDFTFSKDMKFNHLSFEGLITLHDPVRPSIKETIHRVELAGIKTVIMTGDHRGTATAIAKDVGMIIDDGNVLDATELHTLSDNDLKKRLPMLRVISRVSPLDKMRVVKAVPNKPKKEPKVVKPEKLPEFNIPTPEEMLEAGLHFGHQIRRWHPSMEPYIYSKQNNIHVLDLFKTQEKLKQVTVLPSKIQMSKAILCWQLWM